MKLKVQHFGHLMRKMDSLEETLTLVKNEGRTENEMVGSHHQLNGSESEQTLGHYDRQGILACYSPWGCKESDTTERLNYNNTVYEI